MLLLWKLYLFWKARPDDPISCSDWLMIMCDTKLGKQKQFTKTVKRWALLQGLRQGLQFFVLFLKLDIVCRHSCNGHLVDQITLGLWFPRADCNLLAAKCIVELTHAVCSWTSERSTDDFYMILVLLRLEKGLVHEWYSKDQRSLDWWSNIW